MISVLILIGVLGLCMLGIWIESKNGHQPSIDDPFR